MVLTTNAPPVEPIRSATRHNWISPHASGVMGDPHPDIYEAWELPSIPFDRLIARLSDKLPKDSKGSLYGTIILLSGDVHTSFASRLKYSATKRFEDKSPQPASVVFVQLVASSFKKQNADTVDMHKDGYSYHPTGSGKLIPPYLPEGYVGFIQPVGVEVAEQLTEVTGPGISVVDFWRTVNLKNEPTIRLGGNQSEDRGFLDPTHIKLKLKPDYRYTLYYLEADKEGGQSLSPPTIPPIPPGATRAQRTDAIEKFNRATNFYRDYNYKGFSKQQMIGLNNISELTFNQQPDGLKFVNHTVRWNVQGEANFKWATYQIYVNPDDNAVYPDIKAANE